MTIKWKEITLNARSSNTELRNLFIKGNHKEDTSNWKLFQMKSIDMKLKQTNLERSTAEHPDNNDDHEHDAECVLYCLLNCQLQRVFPSQKKKKNLHQAPRKAALELFPWNQIR